MKTYYYEYLELDGVFDRGQVSAADLETAWYIIKKKVGRGALVTRVFEEVYSGRYLVD